MLSANVTLWSSSVFGPFGRFFLSYCHFVMTTQYFVLTYSLHIINYKSSKPRVCLVFTQSTALKYVGQTGRRTDKKTDKRKDRQMNRPTDRQTGGRTDAQSDDGKQNYCRNFLYILRLVFLLFCDNVRIMHFC